MAQNRNKPLRDAEDTQQEEMTVVVMRFKGSGESLQKGFDAVSQAIAALGAPQMPVQQRVFTQQRPAQQPQQLKAPAAADIIDADSEVLDNSNEVVQEQQPAASSNGNGKVRSPPKKCTFLTDFSVSPDGQVSLKAFVGEREISEPEKYILASHWIMKHGGADPFTPNHVFTCFRALKWKEAVDFTQNMRLLKSRKSYFETPSKGTWRLTGIGKDEAVRILGK